MANELAWNLRLPTKLRDRIEPLARADGRETANMARRLLEQAVHERAMSEHMKRQQQGDMQTRIIGGGNADR